MQLYSLAPPGTKVVAYSTPSNRTSWGPHGLEGWYVGPSLDHYGCVKCYFPQTNRERDVDTVKFFPTTIPFPATSTEDYLRQSLEDILALLQKKTASFPFLQSGDDTRNAINKLA